MDPYRIAKNSPITRATVDSKQLRLGDDYIDLTASQVSRLEDLGVKLDKKTSSSSNS
jgi:hypothetical protein